MKLIRAFCGFCGALFLYYLIGQGLFPANGGEWTPAPWYPMVGFMICIAVAVVAWKIEINGDRVKHFLEILKVIGIFFLILILAAVIVVFVPGFISAGENNTANVGLSAVLLICLAPIAGAYLYVSIKTAHYKKYRPVVLTLAEKINTSLSLKEYFADRDRLIYHLSKMTTGENLVSKRISLNKKPSEILIDLKKSEDESINSAIIRMVANCKTIVRDTGVKTSPDFSNQLELFSCRLSKKNKYEAQLCLHILQEYEKVVGKIEETDGMDGHAFEYWCADLLKMNGFTDVEVTKGSGDQGVDIIAVKDSIRYAIQCKCYSSNLGNGPVQEVNAGKSLYHCQIGAVMTNRFFTAGAKELANATGVLLWDRDKLQEMLG